MAYPQKLILTLHQRIILLHRLSYLAELTPGELDDLFNDGRDDALDLGALETAIEFYDQLFTHSNGHLIAISIQTPTQAEVLAECLEGSTYFATRQKGDAVYVHAANAAAELLSTVLEREVVPHIDPRPTQKLA